jgi:hypothetical protein
MTGLAVVMVMVSMDRVRILEFGEDCSPSAVEEVERRGLARWWMATQWRQLEAPNSATGGCPTMGSAGWAEPLGEKMHEKEVSHVVGGRKMHDHTLTLSRDGLDNRVTLLYGRSHSIISIDMTKRSVFVFYTILLLNMCPAIVILC